MKIYFACSIRGGREDLELYSQLVEYLKTIGTVLTEHFSDKNLTSTGEINLTDESIHDRDLSWVLEADVIIAEVSTPSLGVGYELGRAVENNKKILCLYKEQPNKRLSAMIAGNKKIQTSKYTNLEEAKKAIKEFLDKL